MSKKFLIAGAGFRGFCDAIALAKIPGAEVTIIEPAPFFGGLMHSLEVKGFAVDKGVHVFDSIPRDLAAIVDEIMEGQTREIGFVSCSAFNGKLTEGYSLPDLDSLDDAAVKQAIRAELLALDANPPNQKVARTLSELFATRYGSTAARIFDAIFRKVYDIEATAVEANAIAQTSLGRLKFLPDEDMVALKQRSPWLDSVLAARRKAVGKVDDYVSIYPSDGGAMGGWCRRAAAWLEKKGIRVCLGEKIIKIEDGSGGLSVTTDRRTIAADRLIWSNDNVSALGAALGFDASVVDERKYGTPMLFMTLITKVDHIKDFTYLQNFEPDAVTYRTSSAGIYSNQIRDGLSFITSECSISLGSDGWKHPETMVPRAWKEIKDLGIVSSEAELIDSHVLKLPSTFKLAKVGYSEQVAAFNGEVALRSPRVLLRNVVPFFRRDIYFDSLKIRDLIA